MHVNYRKTQIIWKYKVEEGKAPTPKFGPCSLIPESHAELAITGPVWCALICTEKKPLPQNSSPFTNAWNSTIRDHLFGYRSFFLTILFSHWAICAQDLIIGFNRREGTGIGSEQPSCNSTRTDPEVCWGLEEVGVLKDWKVHCR